MSVDVAAILRERVARVQRLEAVPEAQFRKLRQYYRLHIADWICDWGMTYDPRLPARGLAADIPFVLFPKQRDWVAFTFQNWRDGKYGGSEKSRDVGLSWLAVAFTLGLATLFDGIAGGWGSFKEEKVDKGGDMGSMFEKGRYYLRNLPRRLRGGYDEATCSKQRLLSFPDTRSSIIGEIGDNIGRGGRTSIYFVDEAAYLEHDEIVDMALSKNNQCRQDISSVRGMGNSFARRMHDGFSRKFTFHWRDNPLFTEADYAEFRKQWGSVITAQELDIDYLASVEGVIIPQEHVQAAINAHVKLAIKPSGVRRGALDIADRGRDLNAFAARHGILVIFCKPWTGRDSDIGATTEESFTLCDEMGLDGFDYDADGGMGAGVRAFANRINTRRAANGHKRKAIGAFVGSGELYEPDRKMKGTDRTNADMFQNFKAQSWFVLAQRFLETFNAVSGRAYDPDNLISLDGALPQLSQLCMELSQPQWKYSATGKFMVDKVPDNSASPNRGDSVMMLFAPRRAPMRITRAALEAAST